MEGSQVRHVVVIGGGITGLTTARRLALAGHRVTLYESDRRLGGQILTVHVPIPSTGHGTSSDQDDPAPASMPVDLGAEAMHTMAPHGIALLKELGLFDERIVARSGESYLWTPRGRRRLPSGVGPAGPTRLRPVLASRVMSMAGLFRAGLEPVAARLRSTPPLGPGQDIAVGEFVAGRFGRQVVDRFVDPLLGGLHSGDVHQLSLRATTPTLVSAASQGRSLMPLRLGDLPRQVVGTVTRRLPADRREKIVGALPKAFAPAPARPAPRMDFLSWKGGLHEVVDRLLTDVEVEVVLGAQVDTVEAVPGGPESDPGRQRYRLTTSEGVAEADAVVLAVPATAARKLLQPVLPRAADTLAQTRISSTVTVLLGFPTQDVADVPALQANGLLVPSTTGTLLKAMTSLSAKWPQHGGGDLHLVRLSAGRDGQDLVDRLDDDSLVARLLEDLRSFTGLSVAPAIVHVQRWPQGLPQLTVGHLDRVADIRAEIDEHLPGVVLAGASYDGIGLAACIASANSAAERLVRHFDAEEAS
ncbi:protoporphyrinogen oxidase [Austwickia chelonae]|uniref:protoporphyrinogen oxidase n=1 Tax=Austwickia chelonae TaxID=100225 RepID=UPI0013C2BE92|nr:protoporphyrinogen oxidase [Austwickia chelonae]